jgi:hypothetical protein
MLLNFKNIESNFNNLTKEFILSKLSEKEIVERYLNINLNKGAMIINSPFREDNNPSLAIKLKPNGVIIRDFAKNINYDCFSIVQNLYNCNFTESLKIIANDFNLLKQRYANNLKVVERVEMANERTSLVPEERKIEIIKQPFTSVDIQYWSQYNISLDVLTMFNVSSCKQLLVNSKVQRYYTYNNPLYCYEFHNTNSTTYKLYSPYAGDKRYKWLFYGTKADIEGLNQLTVWYNPSNESESSDFKSSLVITKSLKDVMVLYMCGVPSISLQGEQNLLDKNLYDLLISKFKVIYSLYDYDEAGINGSNQMLQTYGIEPLYLPLEDGCKDISDYIFKYKLDHTKAMLDNLLNLNNKKDEYKE